MSDTVCDLRHPEDCRCDDGMFEADPTGHLVVVTWEDTTNMAAWIDPDDIKDFATNGAWRCENVGWVTWSDDDCIVVSARHTIVGEKHLGLSERIPRQAVVAIRQLSDAGAVADSTEEGQQP